MPKNLWTRITKGRETLLFFAGIFLLSTIIFKTSFYTYFSQDDFFHLRSAQANSLADFGKFFSFSTVRGYAFFRPISRELFNFLMWRVFGLNPIPFHLIQFGVFVLNLILLKKLFSKFLPDRLKKGRMIIYLAVFFYAVSSIHLGTFYYLGSFQILSATTLIILSLISFMDSKYGRSFVFFSFALACHEISYSVPGLLIMISLLNGEIRKKAKRIVPFAFMTLIVAALNIKLIQLPQQAAYVPRFSPKIAINNLVWYSLWGIGIPEHLLDYVGPGIKLNQQIIAQFSIHFWIMLISFVGLGICSAWAVFQVFFIKPDGKVQKYLFEAIFWFLLTISPFLLLPTHRFVYYLILPGAGIVFALSLLTSQLSKRMGILMVIFFLLLNINTIKWGEKTYWSLNRSRLAKKIVNQIKLAYPSLPKGATLYLKNDPSYVSPNPQWGGTAKQAFYALSGADGLQLLYQDFTLKASFEGVSHSSAEATFDLKIKI